MDHRLDGEILDRFSDAALLTARAHLDPSEPVAGAVAAKKSPVSSVLDLAAAKPGRSERMFYLFCRFRIPANGIAVSFWARNLGHALVCTFADNFPTPDLAAFAGDLNWLVVTPEVASLCPTPQKGAGNPAVGHCATFAPHYAAACQAHADPAHANAYAKLRAQLFLLLIAKPLSSAERTQ